jgi:hypothetical protein
VLRAWRWECTITGCCRLNGRLRSAEAAFLAEIDRSTFADVALSKWSEELVG